MISKKTGNFCTFQITAYIYIVQLYLPSIFLSPAVNVYSRSSETTLLSAFDALNLVEARLQIKFVYFRPCVMSATYNQQIKFRPILCLNFFFSWIAVWDWKETTAWNFKYRRRYWCFLYRGHFITALSASCFSRISIELWRKNTRYTKHIHTHARSHTHTHTSKKEHDIHHNVCLVNDNNGFSLES